MKGMKLIALAIVVMLVVTGVAYLFVSGIFQRGFNDVVNPPCSPSYNKFNYDWGKVWRSKDDGNNQIVWDDNGNHLIVDWNDVGGQPQTIKTSTVKRQEGLSWYWYVKLAQRIGGVYQLIHEKRTGNVGDPNNEYTTLTQHSTYVYETLPSVKANLQMPTETWEWTYCMLERITRGSA